MGTQDTNGPDQTADGQPAGAPDDDQASVAGPTADGGQPDGDGNAGTDTDNAEQAPDGIQADHVFDPKLFKERIKDLPDEVKGQVVALQKELLGNYTKKTQAIAEARKKIEAYDAFNADPVASIENFAKQFGYELKRPGQAAQQGGKTNNQDGWNPDAGDPNNWNEVSGYIQKTVLDAVMQKLGGTLNPLVEQFQATKKQSIEHELTEIDPSWAKYEDAMKNTLQKHPSLAADPAGLYRLSVPQEVLESRATQRALERMEAKTRGSAVGGQSNKNPKTTEMPTGAVSFQDAIKIARQKIREDGITGP